MQTLNQETLGELAICPKCYGPTVAISRRRLSPHASVQWRRCSDCGHKHRLNVLEDEGGVHVYE